MKTMDPRDRDKLTEEERYQLIITEAADAVNDRRRANALRGITQRLSMYYAPSGPGTWGGLCFAADPPGEPWELATAEPLSPSLPYDATRQWIARRTGRLPIYPAENGG